MAQVTLVYQDPGSAQPQEVPMYLSEHGRLNLRTVCKKLGLDTIELDGVLVPEDAKFSPVNYEPGARIQVSGSIQLRAGPSGVGGGTAATDAAAVAPPVAVPVPTVARAQRAILPLKAITCADKSDTVGTAVVISSDGVFLTALHTVAWGGKIYPEALQVNGCRVTFIKSLPTDDIAVLRLHSDTVGADPWPCVQGALTGELQSTTPVLLMGYAQCVEVEGVLSARQPLITHGLISHTTEDGHHVLADYTGVPNCSGGAVISAVTGNLLGVHIGEVSHPTEPDIKKSKVRKLREPIVVKGLPPQMREKRPRQSAAPFPADVETWMDTLQADVRKAEAKLESKGAVGYFVPCTRLRDFLVQAGVSTPSAETLMLNQLIEKKLEEDE